MCVHVCPCLCVCVCTQRLYERMLELRILLQKALMGSNRLPTPTTTAHLLQPPTQPQQPPTKQTAATDPASEANPQQQGSQGQQEPTKPLEQLQSQLQGLQRSSKDTFCRLLELHDAVVAQPQVRGVRVCVYVCVWAGEGLCHTFLLVCFRVCMGNPIHPCMYCMC